jgi:hypothetical protein
MAVYLIYYQGSWQRLLLPLCSVLQPLYLPSSCPNQQPRSLSSHGPGILLLPTHLFQSWSFLPFPGCSLPAPKDPPSLNPPTLRSRCSTSAHPGPTLPAYHRRTPPQAPSTPTHTPPPPSSLLLLLISPCSAFQNASHTLHFTLSFLSQVRTSKASSSLILEARFPLLFTTFERYPDTTGQINTSTISL